MSIEIIIVLLSLVAMLTALIMDASGNDSVLGGRHFPLHGYSYPKRNAGGLQQQRNDYRCHALSGK